MSETILKTGLKCPKCHKKTAYEQKGYNFTVNTWYYTKNVILCDKCGYLNFVHNPPVNSPPELKEAIVRYAEKKKRTG